MRRRRRGKRPLEAVALATTLALVSVTAGAVSSGAAAPSEPFGRFAVVCKPGQQSNSDPIVFPNQRGASHRHQFFGNLSTGARSTPKSLRRSPKTTCNDRGDRSAYWTPVLFARGEPVTPKYAVAYYSSGGKDPASVQAPPRGLEIVSGDSKATAPQQEAPVTWRCFFGGLNDIFGGPTTEPRCTRGATLVLVIGFPDCWDGVNLDSPDHVSHLAFSEPPSSGSRFTACPSTHPVPIPRLNLEVSYPTNGVMPGGELSSGGVYSGHADFMDGWNRGRLESLVAECIRRARDCRTR